MLGSEQKVAVEDPAVGFDDPLELSLCLLARRGRPAVAPEDPV